jgi:N,N-dimethylformamidase beta subunit-like, C-terminal
LALAAALLVVVAACTPDHRGAVTVPSTTAPVAAPALGDAGPAAAVAPTSGPPPVASPAPIAIPDAVTGRPIPTNPAIVAENSRPGTADWRIAPNGSGSRIEGYADTTSARRGDIVSLFVSTPSATWGVTAYRMGWYGGDMGREVWRSPPVQGRVQGAPTVNPVTHTAEARWSPSLKVTIGDDWLPGDYLLVLRSSDGAAHDVPLTVRDDDSNAALVVVNAVTTWQAYNTWGGCSLYVCPGIKGATRATVVSFDRPYARSFNDGSADFLDHELSLVALTEQLGLDATYVTDVDLDRDPSLVKRHRGLVSLGHDEYYSSAMRGALVDGRDAGVNLAFLGANALYRRIRLEASWDGRPRRLEVNYRTMKDPAAAKDPKAATVQWRLPPLNAPEAAVVGVQYACSPVSADLRVVDPSAWVFAGTGVTASTTLPNVVANEYDRVFPGSFTPANLEVLAHSPLTCRGKADFADMAYYAAPSGAGVFASGTIHWICSIDGLCPTTPAAASIVRQVTANVLVTFAAGPAGALHPSTANVAALGAGSGGGAQSND